MRDLATVTQKTLPSSLVRYDDGLGPIETLLIIWRSKWQVFFMTALFAAAALAYAFFVPPVYQAQTVLKPVTNNGLDALNVSGIYSLTPEEALQQVGASLESYETRFAFFKNNLFLFDAYIGEDETLEQSFVKFSERALSLKKAEGKQSDNSFIPFVELKLLYSNETEGPKLLNELVRFAIEQEKTKLKNNLQILVRNRLQKIQSELLELRVAYSAGKDAKIAKLVENDTLRKLQLEDELSTLRSSLKSNRENRIKQLTEAITIAQDLGLKKPATPTTLSENRSDDNVGSIVRTEINNHELPLYFLGTDVLIAERKALSARKSDDFTSERIVEIKRELQLLSSNREVEVLKSRQDEDLFLAEYASKQSQKARLESLKVDVGAIDLVSIDQLATQSSKPIKPHKSLILAIGVLIGGLSGVFFVLFRSTLQAHKKKTFP